MRRIVPAVVAIVFLAVLAVPGFAESVATLSVSGKVEGDRYKLALEFHPSAETPALAGLLVTAEPSGRLLMAHWNTAVQAGVVRTDTAQRNPLVESEGTFGESQPRVILPFQPDGDHRILVRGIAADGRTTLLMAGQVDLAGFTVTSELELDPDSDELRPRKHCCTCGSCKKMCVDCFGAYFTCDCVGCTIECGW